MSVSLSFDSIGDRYIYMCLHSCNQSVPGTCMLNNPDLAPLRVEGSLFKAAVHRERNEKELLLVSEMTKCRHQILQDLQTEKQSRVYCNVGVSACQHNNSRSYRRYTTMLRDKVGVERADRNKNTAAVK